MFEYEGYEKTAKQKRNTKEEIFNNKLISEWLENNTPTICPSSMEVFHEAESTENGRAFIKIHNLTKGDPFRLIDSDEVYQFNGMDGMYAKAIDSNQELNWIMANTQVEKIKIGD